MSIDWFEISRGKEVAKKEFDDMLKDHVSKKELRAWCEKQIAIPVTPSENTYPVEALSYVANNICKVIIREFCKEEE